MKATFLFLAILFFCFTNAQISNKTEKIIKPLEIYQSFYALNDEPDKIEKKLEENSTSDELFYLSSHGKNPYIKSIAFKILAKKDDSRLFSVFKKSVNSKEQLIYRTECLSHSQLLAGNFFETIIRESHFSDEEKEKLKKEMMELILNSNPVNTKLLEELRYQIPAADNAYAKLRKQVTESRSSELLTELANYKNPDDIDLIKSFGKDAFLAIEEFPDKKFLPFLEDNIQYSSSFPFMFALSSYCDDDAKLIVEKAIARQKTQATKIDCGNNCLTTIYQQVYKNKCELYYPILAKLWVTDKVLSFIIFDYYQKNHTREETIDYLVSGFEQKGEPEIIVHNMYDIDYLNDYITSDLTYDENLRLIKFLEKIKSISVQAYEKAVASSLKNIKDLDTDIFISKLKDNDLILKNKDVLLEKLEKNESAYGLLSIMDGIKILNDKSLFDEGAKIVVKRKSEFSKFPVWQNSYNDFIRKNRIKE